MAAKGGDDENAEADLILIENQEMFVPDERGIREHGGHLYHGLIV